MGQVTRRGLMIGGLVSVAGILSGCGGPSRFKTYNGPPVTQVVVNKSERRMMLLSGNKALKVYDVGLGNEPRGHKQFEGDGKTPEGLYFIDRRNPNSSYHLSIGVSYPNDRDLRFASEQGRSPGGDIFIHGWGPEGKALAPSRRDWTAGCIAVTDKEVEDVYAMVRDGTPILILP